MTPKQKAAQIYDQYWSDVSRRPVSKQDPLPDIRPLIEAAIIAAVEEERAACNQIALDVNRQSSELMQAATTDVNRSYYTGRCNGACLISQRIISRS